MLARTLSILAIALGLLLVISAASAVAPPPPGEIQPCSGPGGETCLLFVSKTGSGTVTSSPFGINCGTTCSAYFPVTQTVTLTAAPAACYRFGSWSGCSSTGTSCTVGMLSDRTVYASFILTNTVLTVTKTGSGAGASSVTTTDNNINCGTTCSATYSCGGTATLNANAGAGFTFVGWGGACSGTGSCTIPMSTNRSVTASFIVPTQLTITKAGAGTGTVTSSPAGINCGSTCNADFDRDSNVVLTATASAGSSLQSWSGCTSSSGNTCTVNMNAAKTVTATFTPGTFQLQVNNFNLTLGSVTGGGIDCGTTCGATQTANTAVTLTAQPNSGRLFAGWGGDCASAGQSTSCTLTMSSNKAVTAQFTDVSTVIVSKSGSGTITTSPAGINCGSTCSAQFTPGTAVALIGPSGTQFRVNGNNCDIETTGSNTICRINANVAFVSVSATIGGLILQPPDTPESEPLFAPEGTTAGDLPCYNETQLITLSAEDAGVCGVANTFYCFDTAGGCTPTTPYTSAFRVGDAGDATYFVRYYSEDNRSLGSNVEALQETSLRIDRAAPTTTANLQGAEANGWFVTDVTVILNSNDAFCGTEETFFSLDGGLFQLYDPNSPPTISKFAGGTHTVEFYSIDIVGNTEATQVVTFQIDANAPTTILTTNPASPNGDNDWFTTDVELTLTCFDGESGCAETAYSFNNGPFLRYDPLNKPIVSAEGINKVQFQSVDFASNAEPAQTALIKLDKTPPSVGLADTLLPFDGDGIVGLLWTANDPTPVSDAESPVESDALTFRVFRNSNDVSGSITGNNYFDSGLLDAQTYAYHIEARDAAGLTAISETRSTTVDLNPPTVPTIVPLPFFVNISTFNIEWNRSVDVVAGVDYYTVYTGTSSFPAALGVLTADPAQIPEADASGTDQSLLRTASDSGNDGETKGYAVSATDLAVPSHESGQSDPTQTTIDLTAPNTAALLSPPTPDGLNGWYVFQVTVVLDPSDAVSGVKDTFFDLDGTGFVRYAGAFVVTDGGDHTVNFYSTDNAGNTEAVKTVTFRIDNVPPVTTPVSPLDPNWGTIINGWFITDVTINLTCDDFESGCDQTFYRLDGIGDFNVYDFNNKPVVPKTSVGQHFVEFYSVDIAGNVEAPAGRVDFQIDAIAPTTTKVTNDVDGDGVIDSVTLTCDDFESGCASINWLLNSASNSFSCSVPIGCNTMITMPRGFNTIEFWSVDQVGNEELHTSQTHDGDVCPTTAGLKAPSEYVLEVLDFRSTSSLATIARVFAGNTEVFPETDGKYHIPLRDGAGNFIIDNTDFGALPKGVWIVDRRGDHTVQLSEHKHRKIGSIVAGVRGDGTGSGTYVYYETRAELDGGIFVRNYKPDKFERQGDGVATIGNIGQDEFTVTGSSIRAQASVRPASDYYQIDYFNLQGCPYGDSSNVELHIVDQAKTGECGFTSSGKAKASCTVPVEGITVKIFDRQDPDFVEAYNSRPQKNLFPVIFESDIGLVGSCVSDVNGNCLAPEEHPGKFLVIGKLRDEANNITVYQGKIKNFNKKTINDFEDEDDDDDDDSSSQNLPRDIVKNKNLRYVKIIKKDGSVKYEAGHRTIVIGSELMIDAADFVLWSNSEELYPFVFTSDSEWEVDVCMSTPEGYSIVGVLDENGTLLPDVSCVQAFVAGESKVFVFSVVRMGSPEPNFGVSIKAKEPAEQPAILTGPTVVEEPAGPEQVETQTTITETGTSVKEFELQVDGFLPETTEADQAAAQAKVDEIKARRTGLFVADSTAIMAILAVIALVVAVVYYFRAHHGPMPKKKR